MVDERAQGSYMFLSSCTFSPESSKAYLRHAVECKVAALEVIQHLVLQLLHLIWVQQTLPNRTEDIFQTKVGPSQGVYVYTGHIIANKHQGLFFLAPTTHLL